MVKGVKVQMHSVPLNIVTVTNQSLLNETWSISLMLLEGSWYLLPVPQVLLKQGAWFNLLWVLSEIPHLLHSSIEFWWPEVLRPTRCILFKILVFHLVKADVKSRSVPQLALTWEEIVTYHKGYRADSSPGSVHWGNCTPSIRINVVSFHIAEASVVI